VGAAAEQARPGGRSFFRGHRSGDTDEMDPVPGDEADGDRGDPEDLRYAPQEPRRGRWGRRIAGVLVLVVVLVLAGVVAYRWSQDQYFVAARNGKVAIFRGVQADMPGISLNHVVQDTDVTVAALPDYPTELVSAGISAGSLADARDIVSRLTGQAAVCPSPVPTAGPTLTASAGATTGTSAPRASAKPSATPSARSSATAGSSPSTGPSPSAAPTAAATVRPPNCIEATP
jgi:protein phosphatase